MVLSSYQDLIHILQNLCKEKRSGIMTISNELGKTAKLILEQGEIFDVNYAGFSGKAALLQIKKISSGRIDFFKGAQEKNAHKIHLTTPEILQILTDNTEQQQEHFIKTQLTTFIGPIAQLIYQEYETDIHQASRAGMLNAVIDKITQQTLSPEKQTLFKQHLSARKQLKLHPATLSLCIKKHSAHGELSPTLLTKLATQIEQIYNLAEIIHLYELLKFLEKTTKTGWLAISFKGKKAGFYFQQGELINAFDDEYRHGMPVACDILHWQPEQMNFVAIESINMPRQIHQTVDMLLVTVHTEIINKEQAIKRTTQLAMNTLLVNVDDGEIRQEIASIYETELRKKTLLPEYIKTELSKQIDQSKHENNCQCLETECHLCLTKAIHLAESYDYSSAEQLMVRILWEQDHLYSAWFWLARILISMTAIEFALKKAAYINIKSLELAEEVKKFTLAKKTFDNDFVSHCPFCWTPVPLNSHRCVYCSGDFFISDDFFVKSNKAKTDIIDAAIARYEGVLKQNSNNSNMVYTLFYLAMAYINRQYYQEALLQLNDVVKFAPDNPVLLKQRELLIAYMRTLGLTSSVVRSIDNTAVTEKILVVEDSAVTRKVIVRTLQANGYEVFEAKDAKEALTGIVTKNPDLVLLDIILPGSKDGYDILAEIRNTPELAKVPVIMLTSRDSLFDKIKGKISDANEYLTKPFQPDELLRVVKKYLK